MKLMKTEKIDWTLVNTKFKRDRNKKWETYDVIYVLYFENITYLKTSFKSTLHRFLTLCVYISMHLYNCSCNSFIFFLLTSIIFISLFFCTLKIYYYHTSHNFCTYYYQMTFYGSVLGPLSLKYFFCFFDLFFITQKKTNSSQMATKHALYIYTLP